MPPITWLHTWTFSMVSLRRCQPATNEITCVLSSERPGSRRSWVAVYEHAKRNFILPFMTACAPGSRLPSRMNGHTPLSARGHPDQSQDHRASHQSRLLAVALKRVSSRTSHHSWTCRFLCPLGIAMKTTAGSHQEVISTTGFEFASLIETVWISLRLLVFDFPIIFLFRCLVTKFLLSLTTMQT